jgi:predicted nucleotidyltransferase
MKNKVSNLNLNQITQQIIQQFNPKFIYLFGSYATGKNNTQSDLDLLIIDEKADKEDLSLKISLALFPRSYHLDLLTYSPSVLAEKLKNNSYFIQKILKEGKKLYERS